MQNQIFTGLHNHTHFSLGDSISSPEDMVRKTKELGMDSLAITDHGTLAGHFQFREACKKHNIKPIFGIEAYFMEDVKDIEKSNNRVLEIQQDYKNLVNDKKGKEKLKELIKEVKEHKKTVTEYNHLILLAKNYQGYQNLVKIHNAAVLDGFYGKPRIDWAVLERYKGGLIASSACLGGRICKDIEYGQIEKAKIDIARFKQIFGEGNFYLELQLHDIKLQMSTNKVLIHLAEATNTPLDITTDTHYIEPEEAVTRSLIYKISKKEKEAAKKEEEIHEIAAIPEADSSAGGLSKPSQETIELITSNEEEDYNDGILTDLYLKNDDMLRLAWKKYMPDADIEILNEAIRNTRHISDKISVFEPDTSLKFPIFETEGLTQEEYLSEIAWKGLAAKNLHQNPVYVTRLKKELSTISKLGFASYFNVVGDMIIHAKKHQSVGLGRGSAAGSLLSFVIGITDVDPIKYELYFERFLDESKGVVAPTFGIKDLTSIEIDYSNILSECSCNQKH